MNGCSGSIATDIVYLSMKSDSVGSESETAASSLCESDSDNRDEYEKDDESL